MTTVIDWDSVVGFGHEVAVLRDSTFPEREDVEFARQPLWVSVSEPPSLNRTPLSLAPNPMELAVALQNIVPLAAM
jgi:hypothetical protein